MIRFDAHWNAIESAEDVYDWSGMDSSMAWAAENGFRVFLTFKNNGPDWACANRNGHSCAYTRIDAFREYVAEFLERYGDRLTWVQFGNEWPAESLYVGTAGQYVEAANVVHDETKACGAGLSVVLGGLATGELRRMAYCDGERSSYRNGWSSEVITAEQRASVCTQADVVSVIERTSHGLENARYVLIDLHLYDDPENWPAIIAYMRRPAPDAGGFIVSEFGGPNTNWHRYNEHRHAYRMYDYVTALDAAGIEKAFLFSLRQKRRAFHDKSGIVSSGPFKRKLDAYEVFLRFSNP